MWLALLFATIGLVPLGLLAALVVWSYPGRPRAAAGGTAEKLSVPINGATQGLILKGRDAGQPVLLYLHGGIPDYFLALSHHARLEEGFTVCWWEQRGSGLSYHADDPPATVDQLVADTLAVTDYLRRRFRKERIYLMGHSGGTYLGMLAVAQAPERYHAYVAVAQIANQRSSEERAYHYMRERFAEQGDARIVARLDTGPVLSDAYRVRDVAMHRLGVGTTRAMRSVFTGIFLRSLQCRDYTLREKIRLWRGKIATGVSSMWAEMVAHDLTECVPEVQVPVYFLHGTHDYTCSYAEARAYYEVLRAPLKAFYTFPDAAHSPIFEDPARAQRILRQDVLQGAAGLADDGARGLRSGMFADVLRDE